MKNLLRGYSPNGKTDLCKNPGEKHRGGWDLVFSPDKSVSVLWSSVDEDLRDKIEKAHKKAVLASLDYIDKNVLFTRLGEGGVYLEKARMVAGIFQHSSNRELEPQLHTHATVFNVAKTIIDGQWRAVESRGFYKNQLVAGNIYKVSLASQMQELGFAVEKTKDSFRLTGVPKDVCDKQSERTKKIEELAKELGLDRETATAQVMEVLARNTRKAKKGLARDFERWQKENEKYGFGQKQLNELLENTKDQRKGISKSKQFEIVREALIKVTMNVSTFTQIDLYKKIAEDSIGIQDMNGLYNTFKMAFSSSECKCLNPDAEDHVKRYTTKSIQKMEKKTVEMMRSRQYENNHKVRDLYVKQAINKRSKTKDKILSEQIGVLRHITQGKDGICFVEGDAGTGKTYTLGAVKEVYEKSGYNLRGISITNKAALQLQKDSGIKSSSVHSFIRSQKWSKNKINDKTILILDEAAMLDSSKFNKVIKICNESGAKLVCVGDRKQIQPIYRGQMFGTGVDTFGSAKLKTIFRQKQDWEKDVVSDLSMGIAKEALNKIDNAKNLHFCSGRTDVRDKITNAWYNNKDIKVNMIASTNKEVDVLNEIARDKLKENGILSAGKKIKTHKGIKEFSVGDKIVFTANDKPAGILNSMQAVIEGFTRGGSIKVKTELNDQLKINPKKFNQFQYAYAITMNRSQGMTIDKALFIADRADREKAYVSFSRGKEGNEIFADIMTFGELPYEVKSELEEMDDTKRESWLREWYKGKLALQFRKSNMKDTSQDYGEQKNPGLYRQLAEISTKITEGIKDISKAVKRNKGKKVEQEYENELELGT